ncbi:hypothetical protein [Candidatus Mycoplasma haematohominis]|uniref:hypothetical protein n=1 Tax=Candidatus Mycoplasma haematohominis TaxID=1494318 RepID=UPI001C0A77DE|nr:hypothetical protein [Candidatus Mycoplasma haemohominis]
MFSFTKAAITLITGSAVFALLYFGAYALRSRDVSLRIRSSYRNRSGPGRKSSSRWFIKEPILGTFGSDFRGHFIDVHVPANNSWWNSNYTNIFLKNIEDGTNYRKTSSEFSNVKSVEDLKKKCDEAYKKNTRIDISPINSNLEQYKYENDVWTYCSEEGRVPVTVLEQRDGLKGRSRLSNIYSSRMISTTSEKNNIFWRRHAASFYGNKDKTVGLGISAKNEAAGFKQLYETEDRTLDSLRELCEKNYSYFYSDEITDIAKETLRFCSLAGSSDL